MNIHRGGTAALNCDTKDLLDQRGLTCDSQANFSLILSFKTESEVGLSLGFSKHNQTLDLSSRISLRCLRQVQASAPLVASDLEMNRSQSISGCFHLWTIWLKWTLACLLCWSQVCDFSLISKDKIVKNHLLMLNSSGSYLIVSHIDADANPPVTMVTHMCISAWYLSLGPLKSVTCLS